MRALPDDVSPRETWETGSERVTGVSAGQVGTGWETRETGNTFPVTRVTQIEVCAGQRVGNMFPGVLPKSWILFPALPGFHT